MPESVLVKYEVQKKLEGNKFVHFTPDQIMYEWNLLIIYGGAFWTITIIIIFIFWILWITILHMHS